MNFSNGYLQVMVEIYNLYNDGKTAEAADLQKRLGQPEWGISTSDVNGMKWIITKMHGYPESSAHCRRPFPRFVDAEKQARALKLVAPFAAVEKELISKV